MCGGGGHTALYLPVRFCSSQRPSYKEPILFPDTNPVELVSAATTPTDTHSRMTHSARDKSCDQGSWLRRRKEQAERWALLWLSGTCVLPASGHLDLVYPLVVDCPLIPPCL